MYWISSEGGPLVLLGKGILNFWNGCRADENSRTHATSGQTDYDRACEISDYTGVISVGSQQALVFGEHMQTTWIPADKKAGGIVVQWLYADDEASALRDVKCLPDDLFKPGALVFHISEPVLYLFDAAIAGSALTERDALIVELNPGDYELATARHEPDASTALVIHRFVRVKAT